MPRPPHPPRLVYSSYTWRRVQITKLLIIQFGKFIVHSLSTSLDSCAHVIVAPRSNASRPTTLYYRTCMSHAKYVPNYLFIYLFIYYHLLSFKRNVSLQSRETRRPCPNLHSLRRSEWWSITKEILSIELDFALSSPHSTLLTPTNLILRNWQSLSWHPLSKLKVN
jgi:hypothetical protein